LISGCDVATARGIAEECKTACRRVASAGGVREKGERSGGRIFAPCGVA